MLDAAMAMSAVIVGEESGTLLEQGTAATRTAQTYSAYNLFLKHRFAQLPKQRHRSRVELQGLVKRFMGQHLSQAKQCPHKLLDVNRRLESLHKQIQDAAGRVGSTQHSIRSLSQEVNAQLDEMANQDDAHQAKAAACNQGVELDEDAQKSLADATDELETLAAALDDAEGQQAALTVSGIETDVSGIAVASMSSGSAATIASMDPTTSPVVSTTSTPTATSSIAVPTASIMVSSDTTPAATANTPSADPGPNLVTTAMPSVATTAMPAVSPGSTVSTTATPFKSIDVPDITIESTATTVAERESTTSKPEADADSIALAGSNAGTDASDASDLSEELLIEIEKHVHHLEVDALTTLPASDLSELKVIGREIEALHRVHHTSDGASRAGTLLVKAMQEAMELIPQQSQSHGSVKPGQVAMLMQMRSSVPPSSDGFLAQALERAHRAKDSASKLLACELDRSRPAEVGGKCGTTHRAALRDAYEKNSAELARLISTSGSGADSSACKNGVDEEHQSQSAKTRATITRLTDEISRHITSLTALQPEIQKATMAEQELRRYANGLRTSCGMLSATAADLGVVRNMLQVLSMCPKSSGGLHVSGFRIPRWIGKWIFVDLDAVTKTDTELDAAMYAACSAASVSPAEGHLRAAEISEIQEQAIDGVPSRNTADVPLLGVCPGCEGDTDDLQQVLPHPSGHARVCWDPGQLLSIESRRTDCSEGRNAILCVTDYS